MMKHFLQPLLILAALFSISCSKITHTSYSSEVYGLTLSYPYGWEIHEYDDADKHIILTTDTDNIFVTISSFKHENAPPLKLDQIIDLIKIHYHPHPKLKHKSTEIISDNDPIILKTVFDFTSKDTGRALSEVYTYTRIPIEPTQNRQWHVEVRYMANKITNSEYNGLNHILESLHIFKYD